MEVFVILIIAFASVFGALGMVSTLIVWSCVCKGIRKRKQTSEPNAVMPSATTSSVQPAYRNVEEGQTTKKVGGVVAFAGATVATAAVVASTSDCGGGGGGGGGWGGG
jgi:ABC-type lipoprotein release transport system permease subunit